MTKLILEPEPRLQAANVTIHHLQLRDLIQPLGEDKVLFVNRFKIEQADFSSSTPKQPTIFCTLDFPANCLSVGCGLLAAGGQQSELTIKPLPSQSQSTSTQDREKPAPWVLGTQTGGSINNAISIEYDTDYGPETMETQSQRRSTARNWDALHRARDEPAGRFGNEPNLDRQMDLDQDPEILEDDFSSYLEEAGEEVEAGVDENTDLESDALAAAYGFSRTPSLGSRGSRVSTARNHRHSVDPHTLAVASSQHPQLPVRLMISNNDQSIKIYRLRQPVLIHRGGKLESRIPGITKVSTIQFPTAVNHSSISPVNRNLIAVGDTPDVFLYSYDKEGKFEKVANYTASSDASFSTAWHPDGHQMAVASQDGVVSVWDVRSSKKIASLSTIQAGSSNGAARVLKFSPNGDYLAFTEHRNYFHIVDTLTYADHQKIMVKPASALGETSTPRGEREAVANRLQSRMSRATAAGASTSSLTQGLADDQRQDELSRRTGTSSFGGTSRMDDFLSRTRPSASQNSRTGGPHDDPASSNSNSTLFDEPSWEDALPILRRGEINSNSIWDLQRIRSGRPPVLRDPQEFFSTGWRTVSLGSREPSINITGLCFSPSGNAIYCGTESLIARYTFVETRKSASNCGLR